MKFLTSTAGRLVIAAVCIAGSRAVVWEVQRQTHVEASHVATFDVTALPLTIGQWSGVTVELDPRLAQGVGALSMVDRSYQNDAGRQAAIHVARFSMADMVLPHPPQMCYGSGGWTILKDDWRSDPGDRRYRLMVVESNGVRAAVAYWYQLGPNVASNREDLRPVLQELRRRGKAWPPLIKVMIHIPIQFSEDDGKSVADELGAGIYDWIESNS